MGISCSINTEFVDLNTVHGAVRHTLIENLNPVHIEGDGVVGECGNKMLPNRRVNGAKAVRIVVIQFPIPWLPTAGLELERIIVSSDIVNGDC